jgi:hypothetical protein
VERGEVRGAQHPLVVYVAYGAPWRSAVEHT